MPDIAKLPELSELFGVTIDELLQGAKGTEIVKRLVSPKMEEARKEGHNERVAFEDFQEVAPILTPLQSEEVLRKVRFDRTKENLLLLAPFVRSEVWDSYAQEFYEQEGIEALVELAPFIGQGTLEEIFGAIKTEEGVSLAPFVSQEALEKKTRSLYEEKGIEGVRAYCPFLAPSFLLEELASHAVEKVGLEGIHDLLPFLSQDFLEKLIKERG